MKTLMEEFKLVALEKDEFGKCQKKIKFASFRDIGHKDSY